MEAGMDGWMEILLKIFVGISLTLGIHAARVRPGSSTGELSSYG